MKALAGLVALSALLALGGLGVYDYVTGDFGILSSGPADGATPCPSCTRSTSCHAPAPSGGDDPEKTDCRPNEKVDHPTDKPAACPNGPATGR
jgi:hypothetical protein